MVDPDLMGAADVERIVVALIERSFSKTYRERSHVFGSPKHNEINSGLRGARQVMCALLEGGGRTRGQVLSMAMIERRTRKCLSNPIAFYMFIF